jgi:hypothetical protein
MEGKISKPAYQVKVLILTQSENYKPIKNKYLYRNGAAPTSLLLRPEI